VQDDLYRHTDSAAGPGCQAVEYQPAVCCSTRLGDQMLVEEGRAAAVAKTLPIVGQVARLQELQADTPEDGRPVARAHCPGWEVPR